MQRLTPIVKNILLLNIGLFLIQSFLGVNLVDILGLRYIASDHFKPYQFFTHLFVHADFMHLFSNMFTLFMFGAILENTLNSRRFLMFYIITGLGAAVLYSFIYYFEVNKIEIAYHAYLADPGPEHFNTYLSQFSQGAYKEFYDFSTIFFDHANDTKYIAESKVIAQKLYELKANIPIVGASGAIFGILMAFAMLFPNVELFLLFLPIPIKAKYFIALFGTYELYAGLQKNPSDNVAHFAHLGGILFAYFFIRWWRKRLHS
ncbi:MAG: rhomboid family intramembrane serine protease [Cytophagales bacterium]|nr:rhomboid family intramembrane serine protease [Cytophagales bacterium]